MKSFKLLCLINLSALCGCTIVPGLHVQMDKDSVAGRYPVVEINSDITVQLVNYAQGKLPQLPDSMAATTAESSARLYKIGPGDIVSVVVWDHPELTNPLGEFRDSASAGQLVSSDGSMFFPYVGSFRIQGMTISEARQFLKKELSKVIQNPQVDVKVAAYRSQRVQVAGEVKQPGVVFIDDSVKGILEAINERGGLTEAASRRVLHLTRAGQTYRVNLAGLLSGKNGVKNVTLLPGDTLHIPDADLDRVVVLGEVRNAVPVTIGQNGLTLIEALTEAGGLDKTSSDDSGILIFRRKQETPDSKPAIYALNLGRPEGMLLASEIPLAPKDVVYVKATDFSKYNAIVNQLLPTISAIFQLESLLAE